MTEYTTTIETRDLIDTRLEKHVMVFGAESSPSGLEGSLDATIIASNNPYVDEVYEEATERYDPSNFEHKTVLARVKPDGSVEWPLEQ